MIQVQIEIDQRRCLQLIRAQGHAGAGRPGRDIVCAAVSTLLRTTARVLYQHPGIVAESDAPDRGRLTLAIGNSHQRANDYLRGVSDLLLCGLQDIARDYPDKINLTIGGKRYGT